jgi:hypothetical protein
LSWEESILFGTGEKLIYHWYGNRETSDRIVVKSQYGRKTEDVKTRKRGILALTNQRLLFLEEHGMFGKSYHQIMTISLEKLAGISMGGLLIPFVSISDSQETHVFHVSGIDKSEFPTFRERIFEWVRYRRSELETEKKKERVQIVIDFTMLKEYMEKGGLILQKTKCPECNAPLQIPTIGNQIVCQHCGSTILAQDIFEKIKSLI